MLKALPGQGFGTGFYYLSSKYGSMKSVIKVFSLVFLASMVHLGAVAQKLLTEGTIVYDIAVQTGSKEPKMADALDGATTTIYVKNSQSRTDFVNALGSESTIHDAKLGNAVILKEYSGQKLMITLTKEDWAAKNKKYENLRFDLGNEEKTIAGYKCKKATATVDGNSFVVYYNTEIAIANKEYDNTFKNLPGLAMEYEYQVGKLKLNFTVSKIGFEPVLAAKFDIPKAGYRVMTYQENQQMKKGNR
jgi:GLPGLI family protein